MTKKRHTFDDKAIYRNGTELCSLNLTEICQVLDISEETIITMDERIKELAIENIHKFDEKELEDAIYEFYKFYTDYNNLNYSERLLVANFADHLINGDLFNNLKKLIK